MALLVMYSLKLIKISLGAMFVEESFGFAYTAYGGILSLGPPEGGTILAQPPI
jgi:drug/metabolite transporter superfamily protein YnfA